MNNKSIVDNILNNYSSNRKIEQNIRNNISLHNQRNKNSRNISFESNDNELNKANLTMNPNQFYKRSFSNKQNIFNGKCNSKEGKNIPFCHCDKDTKLYLKLNKIKVNNLKSKLRKKNNSYDKKYDNSISNHSNLSFNSSIKSKNTNYTKYNNNDYLSPKFFKMTSSQYLITHLNYQIISVKKSNSNTSLKNDILILTKQLNEKEEQIITMNEHIKLLTEELKRIKSKNSKLLNQIQILEKDSKKMNYSNTQFINTSTFSDENTSINAYLNNNNFFFSNLKVSHQFSLSINTYKPKYLYSLKMYSPKRIILSQKNNIKSEDEKTIFKPYDNIHFLKFDILNNSFQLISFADYSNYTINFNKDNITYLNINNNVFIITGKNNDLFYFFNYKKKSITKLSNLKYNHLNGGLIKYDNKIICISGNFTKKIEAYDLKLNKWNDSIIKEMNQERAKSSFLIVNNFIYAFYGYNYIQNKYINNIEYYDNNLWKEIYINNNNLNGIIEHICYVDFNNDIIILGGINEKGFNKNYYKINLNNKTLINIGQEKISEENSVFNSQIIMLKNNYNSENFILCFDRNNNVHRFSPYDISNHQIIIYK